jgi:hypothetical protein
MEVIANSNSNRRVFREGIDFSISKEKDLNTRYFNHKKGCHSRQFDNIPAPFSNPTSITVYIN